MKRLFSLALLGLLACTLTPLARPTPTPAGTPTASPIPPTPAAPLGTSQNPLILALPPSTNETPDVLAAGKTLVGLLEKNTGYKVISVVPPGEKELVSGFANGNAHIGLLSPFAYLLASSQGSVEATFARQQNGKAFYGAQFIARAEAGFTRYYDPIQDQDTAEAPTALAQFGGKKPCWSDPASPSGYVVPLGFLKNADVQTREPAFVAGQTSVVRAVYAVGVCDFGGTYVDARTFPGLQDEFPDLMKKVDVVWRIPPIIPYETIVFMRGMDEEVRRNLIRAFVDINTTDEGKSAMQTLYGFNTMEVVQDSQYEDFRKAVQASGLDLASLIK